MTQVCPLGMLSSTLIEFMGWARAQSFYLQNSVLCSWEALVVGLVHDLRSGVEQTQRQAHAVVSTLGCVESMGIIIWARAAIDVGLMSREAAWHAECLLAHGGMVVSGVANQRSVRMLDAQLTPQPETVTDTLLYSAAADDKT